MRQVATPTPAEPLAALAASLSEPVACAGNRPIRLDDPHTVWFVEHGVLDLFVTEERDGRTVSRLKHVLRVDAGRLVFGAGATGEEASLVTVAKGLPGCRLRRMGLATLMRDAPAEALTAQVDLWIAQCAASLVADITFRPRPDRAIGPGERLEAEAACTLAGRARGGHLGGRSAGRYSGNAATTKARKQKVLSLPVPVFGFTEIIRGFRLFRLGAIVD